MIQERAAGLSRLFDMSRQKALSGDLKRRSAALDGLGALEIGGLLALEAARRVRRRYVHPTHKLFRELSRRGVCLRKLDALEIFGGAGETTREYACKVRSLEVWEKDPTLDEALRHNLPHAKIRIVDCYEEIRRTRKRFDLVLIDNWVAHSGEGDPEHFELFPHVFDLLTPRGVLVVLVVPEAPADARALYPHLFRQSQLEYRRRFYATDEPSHVPLPVLAAAYQRKAAAAGRGVEWSFFLKRSFVYYHAMRLRPI